MTTTSATELKNHLGAYLDTALTEPVFIQKSGRSIAVLVSQQQYAYLQALEDELWALRAQLAEQSGYLGVDRTQQAFSDLFQKDDPC
jgi:prevent-host-death family protein